MTKVRILVKETYQPPIDTPASIQWRTIEVESEELSELISSNRKRYSEKSDRNKYSTFEVVGAEPMEE